MSIPVSVQTVCRLHSICRGQMWDSGKLKEKDGDIIETFPDGTSRVRFRTLRAAETPAAMAQWEATWADLVRNQRIPDLVLLAASNLDFLCIHPFRDGNGRVSRLILLLQLYQLGYEVGRYISIERTIEQNKDRYYETLQQSSMGWHEGRHDPWLYVTIYCLFSRKPTSNSSAASERSKPRRGPRPRWLRVRSPGRRSVLRFPTSKARAPA